MVWQAVGLWTELNRVEVMAGEDEGGRVSTMSSSKAEDDAATATGSSELRTFPLHCASQS